MAALRYRITLRQLVDDYLALQCTRPVTQTSTRYHLAGLLALYGGWQARRLTPQHIMDYLDAQRRSGVSPRTSTHRAKLLRTALQWGVASGRLAANPLSGLRLPTARPRRMDPPTTVEARRMAQVAAPHVLRVIVLGMLPASQRLKHGPCGPHHAAARLPAHAFPAAQKGGQCRAGVGPATRKNLEYVVTRLTRT